MGNNIPGLKPRDVLAKIAEIECRNGQDISNSNYKYFDLKIGFYCCHNCVHCPATVFKEGGNLSYNEICNRLSSLSENHYICLTGGEPTIRPEIINIIRLLKRFKQVGIQTNGYGVNEELCQELKTLNDLSVVLTIHSHDENVFLKTSRGSSDSYTRAIGAAKLFTKHGINFIWQVIVTNVNKHTVVDTFELARSINPDIPLKFTIPHPMGNAHDKELLTTLTELKPLVQECCSRFREKIWFEMVPFCLIDDEAIMFKSQATSVDVAQIFYESGDINQTKIMNMKDTRFMPDQCKECVYYTFGCPGIYHEYDAFFGNSELVPVNNRIGTVGRPLSVTQHRKNFMFERFILWVFITRKCNSKCDYCSQKKLNTLVDSSIENMSEENLRYILDQCVESHDQGLVRKFNINLTGGEAFLNFEAFSRVVPEYRQRYPEIFDFASSTNGTLLGDPRLVKFAKENLSGGLFSLDSLKNSKPIDGKSSSDLQVSIFKNLIDNSYHKFTICTVFHNQSAEELLELAEFVIKNSRGWRILFASPISLSKEKIMETITPLLSYLYENSFYTPDKFDLNGWDLWNQSQVSGCPCGRSFLGVYPDLQVGSTYCESFANSLGKFSWDLPSLLKHSNNDYFRKDIRLEFCEACTLKDKCDGMCRGNHENPEGLRVFCDTLFELFDFVKTLR